MTARRFRWWALAFLTTAVFAVSLPATVLNVALPTLAEQLSATSTQLSWFVSSYLLALTGMLLPAGVMADRWGRKKTLLVAIAVFATGTVLAATARTSAVFLAAQALSGAAAAAVITAVLATVTTLFSDDERPRAVGVWAAGAFLALPVGPVFAGLLLGHAWWGWVFLAILPMLVVSCVGIAATVPETRSPESIQLRGVRSLFSAGFMAAASLAALGMFVLFGVLFGMPQYAQAVLGLDPAGSGLRLLPLMLGVVVAGGVTGRVILRTGSRVVVVAGFSVLAGSLAIGAVTISIETSVLTLGWMFLAGFGAGVVMAAASTAALAAVDPGRAGVGSALFQVVQRIGGGLSAMLSSAVLTAGYTAALPDGMPIQLAEAARRSVFEGLTAATRQPQPEPIIAMMRFAFTEGLSLMLWLCCGAAVVGAFVALLALTRPSCSDETDRLGGGRSEQAIQQ